MGLLKRLANVFFPPPRRRFYPITVKCSRCGEIVVGQVNMANDLSIENGEEAKAGEYYCRKVLIGKQRCFQQIEVQLTFDKDRRLIDRQIVGGSFVDEQK